MLDRSLRKPPRVCLKRAKSHLCKTKTCNLNWIRWMIFLTLWEIKKLTSKWQIKQRSRQAVMFVKKVAGTKFLRNTPPALLNRAINKSKGRWVNNLLRWNCRLTTWNFVLRAISFKMRRNNSSLKNQERLLQSFQSKVLTCRSWIRLNYRFCLISQTKRRLRGRSKWQG